MVGQPWSLGLIFLLGGASGSPAARAADTSLPPEPPASLAPAAVRSPERTVVDFARAQYRQAWLHHPAVGDPSWDTFAREPGNPIYTGREPYLWPVNGFLFRDPPSGRWYAYIGLYPRGYFPLNGGGCLVLGEKPGGGWEELGWALKGNPTMFDGNGKEPGGLPDVSVVHADGRYHMIYDWCDPQNLRGGLGYAWSDKPQGPFHRAKQPAHDDQDSVDDWRTLPSCLRGHACPPQGRLADPLRHEHAAQRGRHLGTGRHDRPRSPTALGRSPCCSSGRNPTYSIRRSSNSFRPS